MSKFKRILSLFLTAVMLMGMLSVCIPVSAEDTATITFDGNGGIGIPADITVNKGTVITLTELKPIKPGMVFRGWAFSKEAADRGEITYNVGVSHQILVNSSATLYASWAYSVTLHPGHQGWGSTQQLYKFPSVDLELCHHKDTINANYGMLPGASGDVANLMVFVEWNTNQMAIGKGNGTAYHERYTANAPATLYCVWGNPIVYSAEGGTFPVTGTDRQEEFVVGHSDTVVDTNRYGHFNMPVDDNAPYKEGCRIYTNENGEVVYARVFTDGTVHSLMSATDGLEIPIFNNNGYSWSAFNCEITSYGETGMLYSAVWEPSVTYKANGGEGQDVIEYMTYAGGTLTSFEPYTVSKNLFSNPDSSFKGWNTKPDGTGTAYSASDVISDYNSSEPLVLYAQWSDTPVATREYTVSFNAMEGYLESDKQSYTISYGEKYTDAIDALPIPTRVGYVFRGWYNEETGTPLMFDNEYYSLTEDTSFVATWEFHNSHILEVFKKEATCAEAGFYTQYCVACDYTDNITYDAVGHSYGSWAPSDAGVTRFCNNCGLSESQASTVEVKQEVIAYVNKDEIYTTGDFAYVDTINYLGPAIDNGAGAYPFDGAYFAQAPYMRQAAEAVNPDVKIVMTIYNRNIVAFESWLKTETTRAQFANHLVGVVTANNFDGIDIDFEFPQDLSLKDEFALLLGEIRARLNVQGALRGKQYILSIATPASLWAQEKYDLVACSQHLDYFNIMNYDLYCGTAVPYAHHHTPPYDNQDVTGRVPLGGSVQSDITMYKSLGIPANKIVSGIGMYSRRWTGVSRTNNGLFQSGTLDDSNIHYDMLVAAYINKNGYVRYWDDNAKAPYLYNSSNYTFLSYEDPESLSYKFEIVARERVRGVMVFDYVTCDNTGILPYIKNNIGTVTHSCVAGNVESKQVTCAENGYIKTYCAICNSVMTHQEIYREGHYCLSWTVTTEATASEPGVLSGNCAYCGEAMTKELPALGYKVSFDPGQGSMIGSTAFIIKDGQQFKDVVGTPTATFGDVPLIGWYNEKYDYILDTEDVFNFGGEMEFTAIWEEEGTHLHRYSSKVTTEATCTADGVLTYSCWCGDYYTDIIPATGHAYDDGIITKGSTCGEAGELTYTCANCGDSYTEAIEKLEHSYSSHLTVVPTCTHVGVNTYTCDVCGDNYTEAVAALGHSWKAWEVTKEATETENGEQQRSCRRGCGTVETEVIHALGVTVSEPTVTDVNNYTVTIAGITDVKEIRFAPGHWTTGSEVKSADGTLTLNASLVAANTDENGVFTYDVAYATEYTFWVRMNDGTGYFLYADTSDITTYLTSNGTKLTVTDMRPVSEIKDIWFAEGTWTTYSEIKNNVASTAKYQATSVKLANYFATNDFSYTAAKPGVHTVLIRYNDGSVEALHIEIVVDVPVFETNGLELTVSNIPGVKVIRTAYGEYNSVSEIKAASGVRNFTNKAHIQDAETFTIPYANVGVVTVIVEYNNGYKHVEQITLAE